jgi:hypothetical protein
MATLTNTKIKDTYKSLLKVSDNGNLEAGLQEITDGEGNASGVQLNTGGDLTASGTVAFGSLKDSGENITITKLVDEADGIASNDNDTTIPTSAAVKDYVDTKVTAEDLDFAGDSGTGSVDLDSQTLTIEGTTNEVVTSASGQTLTIGLPSTINVDVQGDLTGNVTATSVLANGVTATTQATSDNSTKVATTAYVDAAITAEDLDIAGDTGTGAVDLDSQTLTIAGTANEIETSASGQTITIGLPSTITANVTGNVAGDLTGTVLTAAQTNITSVGTLSSLAVSGNLTVDTNTLFVDAANNNVGIGTASPAAKFDVTSSGGSFLVDTSGQFISKQNLDVATAGGRFTGQSARGTMGVIQIDQVTTGADGGRIAFDVSPSGSTTPVRAMEIDSSGRVGIGTSSPSQKLTVENGYGIFEGIKVGQNGTDIDSTFLGASSLLTFKINGSERMRIDSSGTLLLNGGIVSVSTSVENGTAQFKTLNANADPAEEQFYVGNNLSDVDLGNKRGALKFFTGITERMRIDSSGRVLVNGSATPTLTNAKLFISRGDQYGLGMWVASGVSNIISSEDNLALGTTGTERMRILSSGNVGIGTASPVNKLDVVGNINVNDTSFFRYNGDTGLIGSATSIAGGTSTQLGIRAANNILFATGGTTERMRITSGGEVLLAGLTDNTPNGEPTTGQLVSYSDGSKYGILVAANSTSGRSMIAFSNPNGIVGEIVSSGSSTAYNTSSDYRLKENVVPMEGALDRVDALKPSRFNFIADADKTVDGFIAHEVQAIVPEAVTGEKDAVDEEGNPIYQGIDQSKITPLLTAAIKELKALVEAQQAEIETLKSQING